jgi:hypothetical protein
MRRLAVALFMVSASAGLAAQEPDRTLDRFTLALQQPHTIVSSAATGDALRITERQMFGMPVFEPLAGAPTLGPLTFAAPQLRGEFIRLALPIGAYLSSGIRTAAAANRRRQEQSARRRVDAELQAWRERSNTR